MAKSSPAKIKKLAAEAKRAAAANRAAKQEKNQPAINNSDADLERYESLAGSWRELGLDAAACRALVADGLLELTDLRKVSLAAVKELDGMGTNAVRILVSELKKADLAFRK